MNKKAAGLSGVGVIVILFIAAIFSISLIREGIAPNVQDMTNKRTVVNESIDISSLRIGGGDYNITNTIQLNLSHAQGLGWRSNQCPISDLVIKKNKSAVLVLNTHYSFTGKYGNLTFTNGTAAIALNDTTYNFTYANYTYCTTGYVTSSGGRTVARLILTFSALGILGFAIYYGAKRLIGK